MHAAPAFRFSCSTYCTCSWGLKYFYLFFFGLFLKVKGHPGTEFHQGQTGQRRRGVAHTTGVWGALEATTAEDGSGRACGERGLPVPSVYSRKRAHQDVPLRRSPPHPVSTDAV